MKYENSIELTKERRDIMISEIKSYFSSEREENLGDLGASLILDFILEKLAPEFYNQGVYDAHKYMTESAEDLLSILK